MTTMVKERPILFSAPMVRALLAGTKTQTRRIVKPQPVPHDKFDGRPAFVGKLCKPGFNAVGVEHAGTSYVRCPYGVLGDRLWVKETMRWRRNEGQFTHGIQHPPEPPDLLYACDDSPVLGDGDIEPKRETVSSIHMPRWASRITLEVVSVRIERVESITEADAIAEGFDDPEFREWAANAGGGCEHHIETARERFLATFYDLNKRAPRGTNPWVWVVEFKRIGGGA